MKYLYIALLSIVSTGIYSQVGINTSKPMGIFHIDANGDNSATPTQTELANDLIFDIDAAGEARLAIGTKPVTGSQLKLGANNKGLRLNRVKLLSATDMTTIPNPQEGMVVYNIGTAPDLTESVYFFSNGYWNKITTERYVGAGVETYFLKENLASGAIPASVIISKSYGGNILKFNKTLTIPKDGAYVFSVRLSGTITGGSDNAQTRFFIFLTRKGTSDPVPILIDAAGLATYSVLKQSASRSVAMGGTFKKDDEIILYFAHVNDADATTWTLTGSDSGSVDTLVSNILFWNL